MRSPSVRLAFSQKQLAVNSSVSCAVEPCCIDVVTAGLQPLLPPISETSDDSGTRFLTFRASRASVWLSELAALHLFLNPQIT
jgi:hypothetical protein